MPPIATGDRDGTSISNNNNNNINKDNRVYDVITRGSEPFAVLQRANDVCVLTFRVLRPRVTDYNHSRFDRFARDGIYETRTWRPLFAVSFFNLFIYFFQRLHNDYTRF